VESDFDCELTRMGLLIDAVGHVVDLEPGEIEPAPPFGTRVRLEHLLGLGKVGKKLVLLLDIDRMLSQEELLSADALDASAEAPPALPHAVAAREREP
jgi:purine-binding chemotaxis protein CheW